MSARDRYKRPVQPAEKEFVHEETAMNLSSIRVRLLLLFSALALGMALSLIHI